MRKILFLDVDGVLNTERSTKALGLSRGPLMRLREIQRDTNCDIVLSSTWRKLDYAKKTLMKAFIEHGIRPWIGQTESFRGIRGEEIQAWLAEYGDTTTRYAIVDDDGDMLESQLKHFFQTDPEYGLTKNIAYRIAYHLNERY